MAEMEEEEDSAGARFFDPTADKSAPKPPRMPQTVPDVMSSDAFPTMGGTQAQRPAESGAWAAR